MFIRYRQENVSAKVSTAQILGYKYEGEDSTLKLWSYRYNTVDITLQKDTNFYLSFIIVDTRSEMFATNLCLLLLTSESYILCYAQTLDMLITFWF